LSLCGASIPDRVPWRGHGHRTAGGVDEENHLSAELIAPHVQEATERRDCNGGFATEHVAIMHRGKQSGDGVPGIIEFEVRGRHRRDGISEGHPNAVGINEHHWRLIRRPWAKRDVVGQRFLILPEEAEKF
jgi:hypothetical protein